MHLLAGNEFLEPWIRLCGADNGIFNIRAMSDLIDKTTANSRAVSDGAKQESQLPAEAASLTASQPVKSYIFLKMLPWSKVCTKHTL